MSACGKLPFNRCVARSRDHKTKRKSFIVIIVSMIDDFRLPIMTLIKATS